MMMPDVKKRKLTVPRENPYGMHELTIDRMIQMNDERIFRAIAAGKSWMKLPVAPTGASGLTDYFTLMYSVIMMRRVDLLRTIIARHTSEGEVCIFSRRTRKSHGVKLDAWEALNLATRFRPDYAMLSYNLFSGWEWEMFQLMLEHGNCPVDQLVLLYWPRPRDSKIVRHIWKERKRRPAVLAAAWCFKHIGNAWTDMTEPLNNIFCEASYDHFWDTPPENVLTLK